MLSLKNMSREKIIHFDIAINDERCIISSFQQTVEQIELIQEVFLPAVPKLNDTAMKK